MLYEVLPPSGRMLVNYGVVSGKSVVLTAS